MAVLPYHEEESVHDIHHGKLLFVADTKEKANEDLVNQLRRTDYYTKITNNTEDALDHIRTAPPKLILWDLQNSGDSSDLKVIRALKASLETRKIPIIAIGEDADLREKTQKIGGDGFVKKPVNLDNLLNTAERVLQEKLTVLIIDDDDDIVQLLTIGLQNTYRVLSALDGNSAFDIYLNNKVHLMVVDLAMRGTSGLDFLRKVRLKDKHLPVITISGVRSGELANTLREGADYIIEKPFDIEHILAAVRKLISIWYDRGDASRLQ